MWRFFDRRRFGGPTATALVLAAALVVGWWTLDRTIAVDSSAPDVAVELSSGSAGAADGTPTLASSTDDGDSRRSSEPLDVSVVDPTDNSETSSTKATSSTTATSSTMTAKPDDTTPIVAPSGEDEATPSSPTVRSPTVRSPTVPSPTVPPPSSEPSAPPLTPTHPRACHEPGRSTFRCTPPTIDPEPTNPPATVTISLPPCQDPSESIPVTTIPCEPWTEPTTVTEPPDPTTEPNVTVPEPEPTGPSGTDYDGWCPFHDAGNPPTTGVCPPDANDGG